MVTETSPETQELCTRITRDYLEIPGLVLTLPQAAHLWHADAECCAEALERLVASGFLRNSTGMYWHENVWYRAA
jgi:hypothetical protein